MNVINFEDRMAARLGRRAAAYGMDIVREPAGTWALVAWGFRSRELWGVTSREIKADLDICDELAVIDDGEILLELDHLLSASRRRGPASWPAVKAPVSARS